MRPVTLVVIGLMAGLCLLSSNRTAIAGESGLRPFPLPLAASSALPFDVDVERVRQLDAAGKISEAQREFDILAWQVFLALNWPADADGHPDPKKTLADRTSDRVWGFWRSSHTIFLDDGETPLPWGAPGTDGRMGDLFRSKAAWRQHLTSADENFEAFSGPLVDQNGKWARYEVLVNHEEFDYLFENRLYNLDGQVAFSQQGAGNRVEFPANDVAQKKHGAIEIKLAWKELGPNDDHSRFFVRRVQATLSEPSSTGQPQTRDYDAGLVGMHIAMRTRSSPEWVWATFEQIDNVRVNNTADGRPIHPNFFNPDSKQPVNVLPAKNAVIDPATGMPIPAPAGTTPTTWIESLTTDPVQVQRIDVPAQNGLNDSDAVLAAGTAALNHEVQAALQGGSSVFQYYELIGTQWPIHPSAPAFAGGNASAPDSIRQKTPGMMVPVFLINTTMETYFQKGSQPAGPLEQDDRLADGSPPIDKTPVVGTESCVGCHYSAGMAIGFKRNADGSYQIDPVTHKRIPIFGENGNFGLTGNAAFSWLLQIEGQSAPVDTTAGAVPAAGGKRFTRSPAQFLDILRVKPGQVQ
ncbi:hypothetical protein [Telmatospirillum sp.]|uniref:hypothetical protein n=1 Tax=Telmatospirillum sp. TaxID=2079197 RepID=UPI002849EBB4|nr:hypothetical protein [Telmatospirillum sp.]MDR3436942.1 hypothetical protein [Telmatospirillum sp.]